MHRICFGIPYAFGGDHHPRCSRRSQVFITCSSCFLPTLFTAAEAHSVLNTSYQAWFSKHPINYFSSTIISNNYCFKLPTITVFRQILLLKYWDYEIIWSWKDKNQRQFLKAISGTILKHLSMWYHLIGWPKFKGSQSADLHVKEVYDPRIVNTLVFFLIYQMQYC